MIGVVAMTVTTRSRTARMGREPNPWQAFPPRLNFAGVCVMCFERGCDSAKCAEGFAAKLWSVCPHCLGTCWLPDGDPCSCWGGVQEATPAMLRVAAKLGLEACR